MVYKMLEIKLCGLQHKEIKLNDLQIVWNKAYWFRRHSINYSIVLDIGKYEHSFFYK